MKSDTITAMPTTPAAATPTKIRATKKAAAPVAQNPAKSARKRVPKPASKKPARPVQTARPDTKKAIVLDLLRRKQGTTTAEIAKATDWQNHSIRGFISGHVTKKMGFKVESTKSDTGERTYRIAR